MKRIEFITNEKRVIYQVEVTGENELSVQRCKSQIKANGKTETISEICIMVGNTPALISGAEAKELSKVLANL